MIRLSFFGFKRSIGIMTTNGPVTSSMPSPGSKRVHLNVGGHRFTTTVQTLQKDPESMLARLVSDDWYSKPNGAGQVSNLGN